MTPEQILALAPDTSSATAGKGLARAQKWSNLGATDNAIWGECQGSGSKPYQTQIDKSEPAFKCSCPSRKFPCKHGLALYLLFAGQRDLFQSETEPEWVTKWLETRQNRAEKVAQKAEDKAKKEADPVAIAKRSASREAKVDAGLHELELWLTDLIRNGLASAPSQPYSFWDIMGARLIDAQCPLLARRVRELAGVASMGRGWQEELLARLGKIHLVIEGWKRRQELEPNLLAELRTQIGWVTKEEELNSQDSIDDEWWVLGQLREDDDQIRSLKTFLWGVETKTPAICLQFAHTSQQLVPQFVLHTRFRAKALFYPGTTRLRASFRDKSAIAPLENSEFDFAVSISEASSIYSKMLSQNPWLDTVPLVLKEVSLASHNGSWSIRDENNHAWPLVPSFQEQWVWLAESGGLPVTLFGEWNGGTLRPFGWSSAR